jgi:hypothetical protein
VLGGRISVLGAFTQPVRDRDHVLHPSPKIAARTAGRAPAALRLRIAIESCAETPKSPITASPTIPSRHRAGVRHRRRQKQRRRIKVQIAPCNFQAQSINVRAACVAAANAALLPPGSVPKP